MDQYARIDIFNNGRQIPPDIMERLFTAYYTTKTGERGTGIGLYMSKIIIEEHMNGKIELKNVEDGVCCSISIPFCEIAQQADRLGKSGGSCE